MGLAYLEEGGYRQSQIFLQGSSPPGSRPLRSQGRLAELDLRSGDFQAWRLIMWKRLLGKGVKEPVLYLLLGAGYLGKQGSSKAVAALRNIWRKVRGILVENIRSAWRCADQGKKAEAVRYFEETLNASPPVMDSLHNLSDRYCR